MSDLEQDPTLTSTGSNELDSSIDPLKPIEQEGPNAGAITDPELARIGADTEEGFRSQKSWPSEQELENVKRGGFGVDMNLTPREYRETISDETSTEVMARTIKTRAVEVARTKFPYASQELIDQFAQKAADKFKAELESRNAEKKAEKKAEHDKGVQAMIDSLDTPEKSLADIDPTLDPHHKENANDAEGAPKTQLTEAYLPGL